MLDQLLHLLEGTTWTGIGLTVAGGGAVLFLAYEHGWPWVASKFQAIWGSAESIVTQLEDLIHLKVEDVHTRVDTTETDIQALTARVAALETHVAPVVPAPAPVVSSTPTIHVVS